MEQRPTFAAEMRIVSILIALALPSWAMAQLDTCQAELDILGVSCPNIADGSITVITDVGGPYLFSWNGGLPTTNATQNNLPFGPVTILMVDTSGICFLQLDTVVPGPGIYVQGGYCPGVTPVLEPIAYGGYEPIGYVWDTGDSTASITMPPEFDGVVNVTAIDAAGCEYLFPVTVFELPAPTGEILLPDTGCEMTLVPLTTVSSDADNVIWRWLDRQSMNFDDRAVFTESGYQRVTWQGFYADGCPNIPVEDSIFINAQTPAIFTAEQIPCSKLVEISLGSSTDSCAFFVGDSLYFNICNGYIQWDAPEYAVYDFTLYATQPNHCDDTLAITVDVRTEPTLFLANAFSPDGDGINELWPANLDLPDTGYEVEVFDRWGTKMWRTTDTTDQWDGTYSGAPVPIGVYVYTMRHRDPCELTREISKRAHLTIVR